MKNSARTAEYLTRIEERRRTLRAWGSEVLTDPSRTFVLEIGCGHGHFLTAYATAHPEELCVGIDIELDRIRRAERKQRRAGLANLHFVHAEARDFLAALPDAARFSAVYVLFPDPWPKRRHHKHRIMQPPFLAEIAGRLAPGARLYFRTDHAHYFAAARSAIAAAPLWEIRDEPWPFEAKTVFQERAPRFFSLVAGLSCISCKTQ